MAPSGLYARLCHAFLVVTAFYAVHSSLLFCYDCTGYCFIVTSKLLSAIIKHCDTFYSHCSQDFKFNETTSVCTVAV